MPLIISAKNTTLGAATTTLVAEASELGLRPGQWPEKLETDQGSKQPFLRFEVQPEVTIYLQPGVEGIKLVIFND